MGKKSKRRGGGGGGKKNNSSGGSDQPFVPHEVLMNVAAPTSLKGIFSTNEHPTHCVFCDKFPLHVADYFTMLCCGKLYCDDCSDHFVDIGGNLRCAACNTLTWKRRAIVQSEAASGKAWAQMTEGKYSASDGMHNEALKWYVQAAMKRNPDAFLELSRMYRQGRGVSLDLMLSEVYARKARALNPDFGLLSNRYLLCTALGYIDAKDTDNANAILLSIANDSDENALADSAFCVEVAARLWNADQYNPSAEMYARSFCYGYIESALIASYVFFRGGKHALSKLWLGVARLSKPLYRTVEVEKKTWQDSRSLRDNVRSKLREMRNSCGGCGASLAGETRKYCRCCRTYCYCNEDCQKQHWENGHREECKEVEEHMRKILRAVRAGKFDYVNEME